MNRDELPTIDGAAYDLRLGLAHAVELLVYSQPLRGREKRAKAEEAISRAQDAIGRYKRTIGQICPPETPAAAPKRPPVPGRKPRKRKPKKADEPEPCPSCGIVYCICEDR